MRRMGVIQNPLRGVSRNNQEQLYEEIKKYTLWLADKGFTVLDEQSLMLTVENYMRDRNGQ